MGDRQEGESRRWLPSCESVSQADRAGDFPGRDRVNKATEVRVCPGAISVL